MRDAVHRHSSHEQQLLSGQHKHSRVPAAAELGCRQPQLLALPCHCVGDGVRFSAGRRGIWGKLGPCAHHCEWFACGCILVGMGRVAVVCCHGTCITTGTPSGTQDWHCGTVVAAYHMATFTTVCCRIVSQQAPLVLLSCHHEWKQFGFPDVGVFKVTRESKPNWVLDIGMCCRLPPCQATPAGHPC
jgi:hypothetical protein